MKEVFKRLTSLVSAAALTFGLSALAQVCAAPGPSAEKRDVPVYRKSMDESETVECVFFSDMPNVPYMSMELYYKTFLDGEMTVTNSGSGIYTYREAKCGDTAEVNVLNDSFTADDLASFSSTPVYKTDGGRLVMSGPDVFVQVDSVKYDKPASPKTIDMGRYGIDIREMDGVVYYPFATLSDIFGNLDFITSLYADGRIYFMAYYDDINGGDAVNSDPLYLSSLKSGSRAEDIVEMTYKELQLSLEYFYGYPSTRNAFAAEMKSSGLDSALLQADSKTRSLLLSSSSGEYLAGMDRLFNYLLADGGHTGLAAGPAVMQALQDSNVMPDYMSGMSDADSLRNEYSEKYDKIIRTHNAVTDQRSSILGSGNYFSSGNTAFICIDGFEADYQGWKDFFSGSSDMPDDTVAIVYKGLEKARAEGIKNVVLDLSANLGGDTVVMNEIALMITGDSSFICQNLLGDQVVYQAMNADRDLDGAIDGNDALVSYEDMNFAVLTSGSSFSCGTLFPSIMKDMGCMIIGEQSGGGTCAVIQRATADGVIYRMSSYARFVNKDMQTVDDGVPVDVKLFTGAADRTADYSAFYDIERIGREMDSFYASSEPYVSRPEKPEQSSAYSRPEQSAESTVQSFPEQSRIEASTSEQSSQSQEPSAVQERTESGSDLGWISTVVVVFVIFSMAAAALFTVGIIAARKK